MPPLPFLFKTDDNDHHDHHDHHYPPPSPSQSLHTRAPFDRAAPPTPTHPTMYGANDDKRAFLKAIEPMSSSCAGVMSLVVVMLGEA